MLKLDKLFREGNTMWQELFNDVIKDAEYIYDRVVRRWGNPHFAQSTLYDWIWSEQLAEQCAHLSPCDQGALRVALMKHFRIKPWPWANEQVNAPQKEAPADLRKGNKYRGIL